MRKARRKALSATCCVLALLAACAAEGTAGQKRGGGKKKAPARKVFCAPQDVQVWRGGHRLPAVVLTPKGTLMVFTEDRSRECSDGGPHNIAMKRSVDGGKTWSKDHYIAYDKRIRFAGPVPVVERDTGKVWVFYSRGRPHRGHVWYASSEDDGVTWSKPRSVHKDFEDLKIKYTGTSQGIQLSDGRLLVPMDYGKPGPGKGWAETPVCIYSDDQGKTWKTGKPLLRTPCHTEFALVERVDGTVYANFRMRDGLGNQRRLYAVSKDRGITWSRPKDAAGLPRKHTSTMGLARLTDERLHDRNRVVFSGPAGPGRKNMTVWISYDECRTWKKCRALCNGRTSYSNLIVFPDLTVGCAYETNEGGWQSVRFARFSLEWLTEGKDKLDRSKFKKGESGIGARHESQPDSLAEPGSGAGLVKRGHAGHSDSTILPDVSKGG